MNKQKQSSTQRTTSGILPPILTLRCKKICSHPERAKRAEGSSHLVSVCKQRNARILRLRAARSAQDDRTVDRFYSLLNRWEFYTPKFIHKVCGMWKECLWKNCGTFFTPHPLWKTIFFPTHGCGEKTVAPVTENPLIHIILYYCCYCCLNL